MPPPKQARSKYVHIYASHTAGVLVVQGSCHICLLGTWYCLQKNPEGCCFPVDQVSYLLEAGLSSLSPSHGGRCHLNFKCLLPSNIRQTTVDVAKNTVHSVVFIYRDKPLGDNFWDWQKSRAPVGVTLLSPSNSHERSSPQPLPLMPLRRYPTTRYLKLMPILKQCNTRTSRWDCLCLALFFFHPSSHLRPSFLPPSQS